METFELLLNVSLWLLHDGNDSNSQLKSSSALEFLTFQPLLRTQLLLASNIPQLGPSSLTSEMPTRWKSNTVMRKRRAFVATASQHRCHGFLSLLEAQKYYCKPGRTNLRANPPFYLDHSTFCWCLRMWECGSSSTQGPMRSTSPSTHGMWVGRESLCHFQFSLST